MTLNSVHFQGSDNGVTEHLLSIFGEVPFFRKELQGIEKYKLLYFEGINAAVGSTGVNRAGH